MSKEAKMKAVKNAVSACGKGGPGTPPAAIMDKLSSPTSTPPAAPQLPPIPVSGIRIPQASGKPKPVPATPPKN